MENKASSRYVGSNGEKNNDPALNPIKIAFLESIAKETVVKSITVWMLIYIF